MGRNVFAEQVKKYFAFLLSELGFAVVYERYDPEHFGYSDVVLQSKHVGVRCLLDRGHVQVQMAPVNRSKASWIEWIEMSIIVDFLDPNAPQTLFYSAEEFFSDNGKPYDQMIEEQVKRLAQIASRYCEPVLRGDFDRWDDMDEFIHRKAEIENKRLTGKDFPKRSR